MNISEQEYPFHSHWWESQDGHRLHYVDEGPRSDTLVFMVHGNPSWSFLYRKLIVALRDQVRCVAIDHLGCGFSDKPQDGTYTLAQHIERAKGLLQSLKPKRVIFMVHDWGGAIGLGVASQLRELCAGIVVTNTAAFTDIHIPGRIAICKTRGLGTFINRGLNGFAKAAITMAMPKGERLQGDAAAGFLAPYSNWNDRVAIDAFIKDIPMSDRHPTWSTLKEIETFISNIPEVPKIAFWGIQDFCFSEHFLNRFESFWPELESHRYLEASHYLLETVSEPVAKNLKNWLEQKIH
jgi:haloalkane dehalogenase